MTIAGWWGPIQGAGEARGADNAVTLVCVRAPKSCREDLDELQPDGTAVRRTLEYPVKEWTRQTLVAVHRAKGTEIEIRISLTGLSAEKLLRPGKDKTAGHWRLE